MSSVTVDPSPERSVESAGARDGARLAAAVLLFAAWFLLLLFGHPLGLLVHVLLIASLLAVPWRLLRP